MDYIYDCLDKLLADEDYQIDQSKLDSKLSDFTKIQFRRKLMEYYYSNYNDEGYIYCLYNSVYEHYGSDVYKLGCTISPKKRIAGYATSYLEPCIFKLQKKVRNHQLAENLLFYYLKEDRLSQNREFFKTNLTLIELTFEKVMNDMQDIKSVFDKHEDFLYDILRSTAKEMRIINDIILCVSQSVTFKEDPNERKLTPPSVKPEHTWRDFVKDNVKSYLEYKNDHTKQVQDKKHIALDEVLQELKITLGPTKGCKGRKMHKIQFTTEHIESHNFGTVIGNAIKTIYTRAITNEAKAKSFLARFGIIFGVSSERMTINGVRRRYPLGYKITLSDEVSDLIYITTTANPRPDTKPPAKEKPPIKQLKYPNKSPSAAQS